MSLSVCSWRKQQLLDGYQEEILPGDRVIDIGCGNGVMGKAVAERYAATVVGADVVNLLCVEMQFYKLPEAWLQFSPGSFDIVMLNDALHHMSPEIQYTTLKEAIRVGKKVLIFETRPTPIAKIADLIMAYLVYGGREAAPLTHREPEAWDRLLRKAGVTASIRNVAAPFFYPLRHFIITAMQI